MADLSKNKYTELLVSIILFILSLALLDERGPRSLIVSLIFLGVIISIIRKLHLTRIIFALYVGCAVLGFLFEVIFTLKLIPQFNVFLYIISNFIYVVFLYMAIVLIGKRISKEKIVTSDTFRGGVCMYLFIGALFSLLYQNISLIDSKAFFYSVERRGIYKWMYYSFTTLTTLGYGDIVPLNRMAMLLSNLESSIGILFPAVFIARLVSLYSVQDLENED
jgi:hypothetical protein